MTSTSLSPLALTKKLLVWLAILMATSLPSASPTLAAHGFAKPGHQEPQPGQPIVIRWSTETEVNTAGFNLYRASREDGPWEKINERLIPGAPDPLRGGTYVFTDTEVIAGQTYWYELEEVETSGKTTRLQRTEAVAEARSAGQQDGLPCGTALLPVAALVAVVTVRRNRGSG
jgi:hypothetical protein